MTPPQAFANQRNVRRAGHIFGRHEVTADFWLEPDDRQKSGTRAKPTNLFRSAATWAN